MYCIVLLDCIVFVLCCCLRRVVAPNNDAAPRVNDSRIYTGGSAPSRPPQPPPPGVGPGQKARLLVDYDAADMTELSLAADEVSISAIFSF